MGSTVVSTNIDFEEVATKLRKNVETAQRYAAIAIYGKIIAGNPVDTGFSRANWNLSVGSPDYTVQGVRNPKATYAAPSLLPGIENAGLDHIFIANGVDYVTFLEEGSSQQAPNGFIRLAVEQVESEIQQFMQSQP